MMKSLLFRRFSFAVLLLALMAPINMGANCIEDFFGIFTPDEDEDFGDEVEEIFIQAPVDGLFAGVEQPTGVTP